MEQILVRVAEVNSMGAEIHSLEHNKPHGCPGLGGWKFSETSGCWWTRVKGADAKRFKVGTFPTITLENDAILSVE